MRRSRDYLLATLLLVATPAARGQEEKKADEKKADEKKAEERPRAKVSLADLEDAVLDVADRVRPAVVTIEARHEGDPDHVLAPRHVTLSGTVWDDEGSIVALGRDLDQASALLVSAAEGESLRARLEGIDDESGIALLKVDGERRSLRALERGASERLRPGSFVVTVGNPLGLRGSVSFGTVAGVGRTVRRGPVVTKDALQLTVAVNPGDPGGAVADARGKLVGLLASPLRRSEGASFERDILDILKRLPRILQGEGAKGEKERPPRLPSPEDLLPPQGISFALPVEEVARAVERIQKEGGRPRVWLGIDVLAVDEKIRKTLGLEDAQPGVLVIGVREGSPAAKASLKTQDVLVTYNGRAVKDLPDLRTLVRESAPGVVVKLEVVREGKRIVLEATLEGRKP